MSPVWNKFKRQNVYTNVEQIEDPGTKRGREWGLAKRTFFPIMIKEINLQCRTAKISSMKNIYIYIQKINK